MELSSSLLWQHFMRSREAAASQQREQAGQYDRQQQRLVLETDDSRLADQPRDQQLLFLIETLSSLICIFGILMQF